MDNEVIELQPGEVKELPAPRSGERAPLVGRTTEDSGADELFVLTPGKDGIKVLPYGAIFLGYEHMTNVPIWEIPEELIKETWEELPSEPVTEPEPTAPVVTPDTTEEGNP